MVVLMMWRSKKSGPSSAILRQKYRWLRLPYPIAPSSMNQLRKASSRGKQPASPQSKDGCWDEYGSGGYATAPATSPAGYLTTAQMMTAASNVNPAGAQAGFSVQLTADATIAGDGTYSALQGWSSSLPSQFLAAMPATGPYVVQLLGERRFKAQVTFDASAAGNNNIGQRSVQLVLVRGTNTYVIAQATCQPSSNVSINTLLNVERPVSSSAATRSRSR